MRVIKGRDMKKTIIAAIFTLLASATTAQAMDVEPYVGVGVGGYLLKDTTAGTKIAYGGYGQLGADIGDYLGAELRFGASGKATRTTPVLGGVDVDINTNIDYIFSFLGKLQMPVSEKVQFYGLLGATRAKVVDNMKKPGFVFISTGTTSRFTRTTSFSFGGGLDFKVQDKLVIGAEYMHYYKNISGFSANIKYSF